MILAASISTTGETSLFSKTGILKTALDASLGRFLGMLFPPRLGRIDDPDNFIRYLRIANGELKVYTLAEDPAEGVGTTMEWTPGRWGTGLPKKQGYRNTLHGKGRIETEGMGEASLG